ncbi:hypothetical protein SEA_SKOG_93 [Gordonia phage Skog]|uniref:Uncharacterized protein n=1 Tax=Gordonia phage Skog TaxID=2704033 RepID=A0A6G6XK68_9CAUD|nr:hypothetical protein KHQ85_gp093 [Gordonia phage Skog]QIG58245.1 hypothetical protein SEA_SKOG_93 [Gordonia phage Skog]
MSADRWSVCSNCVAEVAKRSNAAIEKQEQRVADAYGTLPFEEFSRVQAEVRANVASIHAQAERDENSATLREDYEFYLEDGTVEISYKARCTECGFGGEHRDSFDLHVQR